MHETIDLFTQEWWIVNFITITTITLLLLYAKSLKNSRLIKFTYLCGIFLCSRVIFMQFYQVYIDKWFAASSIPIHLCGLAAILSGLVILKRNQLAYECLFYWGLAGAFHSLLTPELTLGKSDSIIYADYFISHGGIIFSALLRESLICASRSSNACINGPQAFHRKIANTIKKVITDQKNKPVSGYSQDSNQFPPEPLLNK